MQQRLHTALLQHVQPDQVTLNETVLLQHSRDESYHEGRLPDVVVFPRSTEDVQSIMHVAQQLNVPVVPFGVGSALEGQVVPLRGGISIDFSEMNRILDIHPEDLLVTVQPGVTRLQLNEALRKHGLFFPVDPGADATLGGMAATNASGTTSVRYGVMRDQVRQLEVVLADGRVIETGSLAAKSSSGYHLTGLFVGSEGTLGCFTKLTLRVHGIPEHIVAARAAFQTVDDAVQAATAILQSGVPVARVELVDDSSMKQANLHSETNYEEVPHLFFEFHGNEAGLTEDVEFTKSIVDDFGCVAIEFEHDQRGRNRLWEARHQLAYAYLHAFPSKKMMTTDVAVPISALADAIQFAREQIDAAHMHGGVLGHVGDGNFHALVMMDPTDEDEVRRANTFSETITQFAIERGGTCTGEHGVGIGKMKYQRAEHGASLDLMRDIKQLLDPNHLLNPGKLIDEL